MNTQETAEHVSKTYTYNRNGKQQTVKRDYDIKGLIKAKREELSDYFNHEFELNPSKSVKEYFIEYNKDANFPVSYSMFYTYYTNNNGTRKGIKQREII